MARSCCNTVLSLAAAKQFHAISCEIHPGNYRIGQLSLMDQNETCMDQNEKVVKICQDPFVKDNKKNVFVVNRKAIVSDRINVKRIVLCIKN